MSLVVDDYGTGFSSLGYLRDLRDIRGLKLDRSFVTRLDADPRAGAIVESTINLAHALGHARRRRGRGDRAGPGPARRARLRVRAGVPVLPARSRRRTGPGHPDRGPAPDLLTGRDQASRRAKL